MSEMPLLDGLLRFRYVLLGALTLVLFLASAATLSTDNDWQFFTFGADTLFGAHEPFVRTGQRIPFQGPGGLHVYASYPFLQIGPPGLLLAKVLQWGPKNGLYVAGAVVQTLGLLALRFVDRATDDGSRRHRVMVLLGGAMVMVGWTVLAHVTHLDDALTLVASAAAAWALSRGRFATAGCLLGLAAASKPWGVVLLALVLVPPTWRLRATTAGSAVLVAAAFWGPFLVWDRGTVDVGKVRLPVSPSSALAVFTSGELGHPSLLRLTQFAAALLVAAALVLVTGRWQAAMLAALAVRLLLEPGAYQYYVTGPLLAALLADLALARTVVPALTGLAFAGFVSIEASGSPAVASWVRLIDYALLLTAAMVTSRARPGSAGTAWYRDPRAALRPSAAGPTDAPTH
jgi:hypothetical protein